MVYLGSDQFYAWLRTIGVPLPKDATKMIIIMKHSKPVKLIIETNIRDESGGLVIEDNDVKRETRKYRLIEVGDEYE